MIIYSKKIVQFIQEIKRCIKNILSKEIGLKVFGDRFYDKSLMTSYPIKVVIYNNKSMLGYFDPNFLELGFHERLMYAKKEQLQSLIRHEIAHYIVFTMYGENIQAHGAEFRDFCKQSGWGEEIYKATMCLEEDQTFASAKESHIFRKVQKLMALANSSNKHEAEQAIIKSQQLLLKHNIEAIGNPEEEEKIFLKRIMKQKKENVKMRSIATILETFFVHTVYNRAGGFIYLEILGNAVNVEIAEYVASVLDHELDRLWDEAKAQAHLKGKVAKNSFLMGIAKGYCYKIQALKRDYTREMSQSILVIEKTLLQATAMAYERLSSSRRSMLLCRKSSQLGEKMGYQLNIHSAIEKPSNPVKLLIDFFKKH